LAATFAAVSIALSGCATFTTQMHQEITVTTPMVDGASCSLQNVRGMWMVTTPGKVQVLKSKTEVQIRCMKDEFQDGYFSEAAGIEPWVWGNFVIGGLLGFSLDWATGSIHKYRPDVVVRMRPAGAAANSAPPPPQPTNTASNRPPTS
jgi:hypothetical protein